MSMVYGDSAKWGRFTDRPLTSKFIPTDPIPAYWYDAEALAQLIGAHNLQARNGGKDLALGEFIRNNFRGLASTKKAKDVASCLAGISHLSDFEMKPNEVPVLLDAMQRLSMLHPTTS